MTKVPRDFPEARAVVARIAARWRSAPLPRILVHATRASNLESVMGSGLQTRFHGAVHGCMEVPMPEPAVYLSRHRFSNNLNAALFHDGQAAHEVVCLQVDASRLDPSRFYPDDALWLAIGQGDLLFDAEDIENTLGVGMREAQMLEAAALESVADDRMPGLLRPLWPWYLAVHGEVSYAADIPAAIRTYVPKRAAERTAGIAANSASLKSNGAGDVWSSLIENLQKPCCFLC